MTDDISNPQTALNIALDVVKPHVPSPDFQTGAGPTDVDHAAEISTAQAVGYSPEHQAEVDRDAAASRDLIEALRVRGSGGATLQTFPEPVHPSGYTPANLTPVDTRPVQAPDSPMPAWTAPVVPTPAEGAGK
jgi:hypothetical protein